jgi:hypothetical protein
MRRCGAAYSELGCKDAPMEPTDGAPAEAVEPGLTYSQAYEAAYRFVWQYMEREPIEPFFLMLVAMEPVESRVTNDPASWHDWLACVEQTLAAAPLPQFPRTDEPR